MTDERAALPDHDQGGEVAGQPAPAAASDPAVPLTLETEDAVRRDGIGGRAVAGVVGVLLLVGGTIFAVAQTSASGPGSAEEAVSELLDAASDEDVLGVLAALDPGERDALRGPVEDLFVELERLEVVDASFRLDGIAGFDVEFHGLTFRTEYVRDGLARVYLTGGTVTTSYDADELPIGDFVSDTIERFGGEVAGASDTETTPVVTDVDDPEFLVARRGDDGWRVSIGYTIAEHARMDAGAPVPDPALAIAPLGAPTPEAAVEAMARSAAELDLRGVIARLAPGELGVLQEYAALFIDDAEQGIADEASDLDVTLGDLQLRSETDGDRASVFVEAFSLTVESDGSTVDIDVRDSCMTLSGDLHELGADGFGFEDGPICSDDLESLSSDAFAGMGFADTGVTPPSFPPMASPSIGIQTVREDGGWYVAPLGTTLDAVVSGLEVIDRAHLDAVVDFIEEMMNGFARGFEHSDVGSSAMPPDLLDGFDDLEGAEIDVASGSEFGEAHGTTLGPDQVERLNRFIAEAVTGDPDGIRCIAGELLSADAYVVRELVDAHEYGFTPVRDARDTLDRALTACGFP